MWLIKSKKWLKQAAINLEKNEQGCILCKHFRRDIDEPLERCDKLDDVMEAHGAMRYTMWIGSPTTRNNCSFYTFDTDKLQSYKIDLLGPNNTPVPVTPPVPVKTTKKYVWLRK